MIAVRVRYLNGWSMAAADGAEKKRAEWPPHPDRLFMAFAAAWFESGMESGEGQSLRWLESLPAPEISASDYSERSSFITYVPTNDDPAKKEGLCLIPAQRTRQPRSFPIAIPADSTVSYLWEDNSTDQHLIHLRRLAAKVTHIGHSASLVQVWVEENATRDSTLVPTNSIATHRLRVPSEGSLDRLAENLNRDQCIAYRDLKYELEQAKEEAKEILRPPRSPWGRFPDVVLLADEKEVKHHPLYSEAKCGNWPSAMGLVQELVTAQGIEQAAEVATGIESGPPILVAAHAREDMGFNAIPAALSFLLAEALGLSVEENVLQANVVQHTGADGFERLARQAAFEGKIRTGEAFLLVDDFVGQGGTLANLRGWIEKQGRNVIGAITLTGKPYSAKLTPSEAQINELKSKHGSSLERWWEDRFGHSFNCLTQSEARYLANSPNVDAIRNKIIAAVRKGSVSGAARSQREQRNRIQVLSASLKRAFPAGEPPAERRPKPLKWQGYSRHDLESLDKGVAGTSFDPRLIVLAIKKGRVTLPSTLRLTSAFRGLLLRECSSFHEPVPEWITGHLSNGGPSVSTHVALTPLPFVGADYADGRTLGIAIVLPKHLASEEARRFLNPVIWDASSLPRQDLKLFDGSWLECGIELETRADPPYNLRPNTWVREAQVWASVTPVVLNRHFDGPDRWEKASESVKDACEHIELPRPSQCLLHPVSRVEGVPHARSFPQMTRKRDGGRQSHSHAVLAFEEDVRGPVLVGAGRFRGYGLFRPIE